MQQLLEQIRALSHVVTETIYYFRVQNHSKAYKLSTRTIALGEKYFETAILGGFDTSVELLLPIWKELLEATELGDEVRIADIYELELLDALYQIQSVLVEGIGGEPHNYWYDNISYMKKMDFSLYKILDKVEESEKRAYALGWAQTGDMLLSVETKKGLVALQSVQNPWKEAFLYSQRHVDASKERYIVFGLGLGYHIECMLEHTECKEVIVLENDLEQLRIALSYRDLSKLLSDSRVRIVLCEKPEEMLNWLAKDSGKSTCCFWYPSIKTIQDISLREALENYWVASTAFKNVAAQLKDNFEKNVSLNDENAIILKREFAHKKMILVAAGPSLDDSIDGLGAVNDADTKIVCVGKVAKKLIHAGIMPDLIVMLDGMPKTRWQISGIEDCQVPLLYLSTVSSNVVSEYHGKRYIAYQEGFEPAEKAAKVRGVELFKTGGSVATLAIDFGIQMECSEIICVGLDMGYSGEHTHASGLGRKVVDNQSLRKVEGVSEPVVYTSKSLDIFRNWIEERIKTVKGITFINASNGARIHGMQEKTLKEIF